MFRVEHINLSISRGIFSNALVILYISRGYQGHLIATGGPLCPYRLVTLYFNLLGLYFGDSMVTDENFVLCRVQTYGEAHERYERQVKNIMDRKDIF